MAVQRHSEGPIGRFETPPDADPFNIKDKKLG